jgi:hypothetical protein
MKKSIIYTGLFFLLLNVVLFLLLSSYVANKFVISEISIALSFALIYYIAASRIDDGFKIFLTLSFVLTGISKFILSFFFKPPFSDNGVFIAIVIITAIELLSIISIKYFSKHS